MAERVAALRQTERRQRILAEHADLMARARESGVMIVINRFESMYLLADPVDYDLKAASSLTELARAQGADPAEWVYDAMLEHDGTQLFYAPILNFADRNFGAIQEMIDVTRDALRPVRTPARIAAPFATPALLRAI